MSPDTKKLVLKVFWLLSVLFISTVIVRGEDSYPSRSLALQEAIPHCNKVEAKVIENRVVPVQRLTRRGPREEKLEHTKYSFVWQGATLEGLLPGHDEPGTTCDLWVDSRPPHDAYRLPPDEELRALKLNHYGTMLVNNVFFISFVTFFLTWLSAVWIGRANDEIAPP